MLAEGKSLDLTGATAVSFRIKGGEAMSVDFKIQTKISMMILRLVTIRVALMSLTIGNKSLLILPISHSLHGLRRCPFDLISPMHKTGVGSRKNSTCRNRRRLSILMMSGL